MIPISDELPTRRFPIVTVSIIAANILVFAWQLFQGAQGEIAFYQYGLIPSVFWGKTEIISVPFPPALTIFSSMFMHGNLYHLVFNMLYLWIFGNNVEDFLGRFQFILFYLGCGLAAGLTHAAIFPNSLIPTVGASGAIAGVMGGYLVLFPHARVVVLVFWLFFITFVRVPAALLLGFWILLQIIYGLTSVVLPNQGGVAWFAHIGGFLLGAAWCRIVSQKIRPKVYW